MPQLPVTCRQIGAAPAAVGTQSMVPVVGSTLRPAGGVWQAVKVSGPLPFTISMAPAPLYRYGRLTTAKRLPSSTIVGVRQQPAVTVFTQPTAAWQVSMVHESMSSQVGAGFGAHAP